MKLISHKDGLADHLRNHPHRKGIIVSIEKKFIYMKPTKTAGTSILRHFLQKEVTDLFNEKDDPVKFADWVTHITDEELKDYFIFSVVRNPWDRFLSSSKYLKIPLQVLIDEFDKLTEDVNVHEHTLPTHFFSHHQDFNFADYICRFECLQADMNIVCDHLKIPRKLLPVTNTTSHSHYSNYYDEQQIAAVSKIYDKDIQYFGYSYHLHGVKHKKGIISKLLKKV